MESKFLKKPSHKEWRRLVKKKRRQLLRQKAARERDKEAERVQQILEKREDYVEWQQELKALEEEKEKLAQKEHEKLEEAWLEAEVRNDILRMLRVRFIFLTLSHQNIFSGKSPKRVEYFAREKS